KWDVTFAWAQPGAGAGDLAERYRGLDGGLGSLGGGENATGDNRVEGLILIHWWADSTLWCVRRQRPIHPGRERRWYRVGIPTLGPDRTEANLRPAG
ncbi:hypothetical protein KI387_030027, partial [Taxus chinensis]